MWSLGELRTLPEMKRPEKKEFEIMDEGVDSVEEELIESEEEVDL